MTKLSCALCVASLCTILCGCAGDTIQIQDSPDYADYSPGYTGYTQGYDGYGDYDNGFGPSFWNPRYYFYTGYLQGYKKYPHPQ